MEYQHGSGAKGPKLFGPKVGLKAAQVNKEHVNLFSPDK